MGSWKVAPPLRSSLQPSALSVCLLLWHLPRALALALLPSTLLCSATSQPHTTAGPSALLLLTAFLPGCTHFTAPKDFSLLFASAFSRFLSSGHVAFFLLTSTGHSAGFHHLKATDVYPGVSVGESKARGWETWTHQPGGNFTLNLFPICIWNWLSRTAEQQARSTLILFPQNKLTSYFQSPFLSQSLFRHKRGNAFSRKGTVQTKDHPSLPGRRLPGRAEYRTGALAPHNPIPISLFPICAPVSASSWVADGNALPHQHSQITSIL